MEKHKKKLIFLGLLLTICVLIGTSYAWWTSNANQSGINEIKSTCLRVSIENESGAISFKGAYPITDSEAVELEPYRFTIKNNCKTSVNYTVKLEKMKEKNAENELNILKSEYVAVEFNGGDKKLLDAYDSVDPTYTGEDYTPVEARKLINGTLEGNGSVSYTIKLWMDEHVTVEDDAMNKSFISKIVVDASFNKLANYTEPLLNGADPVLESTKTSGPVAMLTANGVEEDSTDKLIPVIISEKDGSVKRADLTNEWYDYETKKWANAVILKDEAETPDPGDPIPEDDIESYFVWIPKYKYKIQTLSTSTTPTAFDIVFGTENTIDKEGEECPPITSRDGIEGTSGESGDCTAGEYMTHPAFLAFGGNGLWVGKFETGHDSGSVGSAINEYSDDLQNELIIKPNEYSWTSTNVSTMYQLAYNYQRDLESHMMKNTEWGAVAYLTQSIYGRCTKSGEQTTCTEVERNNNSGYVTGYAVVDPQNTSSNYETATPGQDGSEGKTINYNNHESVKASTTGNYTGIFDMSGGALEYVMGVMYGTSDNNKPASGYSSSSNSGFKGPYSSSDANGQSKEDGIDFPDAKYYDVYKYSTSSSDYTRRILGDATAETKGWNSDSADFVYSSYPWFLRGGGCSGGTIAGVFFFNNNSGNANSIYGFRLVLAM